MVELKKRKLALAVAAMVLAVQVGGHATAAPNLEQLNEIAELLGRNDVEALRAFVEENQDLLEGESTLSTLLRRFMAESADITTFLGMEPDLDDALAQMVPIGPAPEDEGSDSGDDPDTDDDGSIY